MPEPAVNNRQLDYLYTQLEQLKTNMREKQSSLANIIDVQKKRIEDQGCVIQDLDKKLKYNQMTSRGIKKAEDFVFRDFVKNHEAAKPDPVKTSDDNKTSPIKGSSKNFRELYQKAAQDNTRKDCEQKSEDYDEIDLYDDDDNDSFITIDEDYEDYEDEDEDGESDSTLENSQSSDSGYTDSNGSSYGVNPMFSLQANDGTEACQDDFVFFNQTKGDIDNKKSQQKPPQSSTDLFGSLKKSHRIVIINKESALVCNESCLI